MSNIVNAFRKVQEKRQEAKVQPGAAKPSGGCAARNRGYVIDLLLTNGNDKSPNIVDAGAWRFVIGKEKVNKCRPIILKRFSL